MRFNLAKSTRKRTSALAFILAGAALPYLASVSNAEEALAKVRAFPYPYNNMVSFASDADTQTIEHGIGIHGFLNDRLGLAISDSIFPMALAAGSFFRAPEALNRELVQGMPSYAVALRQWHRGNIDHFHSWNEGAAPRVVTQKAEGLPLRHQLELDIAKVKLPFGMANSFHVLRLRFSAPPPDDLALLLTFEDGKQFRVPPKVVTDGRRAQVEQGAPAGYIADILTAEISTDALDFSALRRIAFESPSCDSGCEILIEEVARDQFSRSVALLQMEILKRWNVRPFLYTSHGSATKNDAFGTNIIQNSNLEKDLDQEVAPLAANPRRHAYIVDILKKLNVGSVWPYDIVGSLYEADAKTPRSIKVDGFHVARRTWIWSKAAADMDQYKANISARFPGLSESFIKETLFCNQHNLCGTEQGTVIGILPAVSLLEAKRRGGIDHLWYTHFGTASAFGAPLFTATNEQPFPPASREPFAQLAEHHYNFSSTIPERERIWVTLANTAERYRRMLDQISKHARYDAQKNIVDINSWIDPVLQVSVPEAFSGTRDLNGLTIYVTDSGSTKVRIDNREIDSFTRNSADDSGQQSITIVDDSGITALIGHAPLHNRGIVTSRPADMTELSGKTLKATDGGQAALTFVPSDLHLWNTSHLKLRYRKFGQARFYANVMLVDGQTLRLEEGAASADDADAFWTLPSAPSDEWTTVVVATADAIWRTDVDLSKAARGLKRLPLPLGRIREIEVGMTDAAAGAELSVDHFYALRPNGNGIDPAGRKLVSGRVLHRSGGVAAGVQIEATDGAGGRLVAETDADGFYYFTDVPRGSVMNISVLGASCYPLIGSNVEVLKDEVEVDIDMAQCNSPRNAAASYRNASSGKVSSTQ